MKRGRTQEVTETEIVFRRNLLLLIDKTGKKRGQIAVEMGIDKAQFYKILASKPGTLNPTFPTMEKIAKYFNINVYELFI